MVEYHDRIALKPIASFREFLGLCKIPANDKDFQPWEGFNPLFAELLKQYDIWLIIQWHRFEDGRVEVIGIKYIADATEEQVLEQFESYTRFLMMTKEQLDALTPLFNVPEDDRNYIADRFPVMPPDPASTKEFDLYQARLQVLAGMQPKAVAKMQEAFDTEDPVKRAAIESDAVAAYYAEMAHYWRSEEVTAWQRTNPIGAEWICEFASVMQKPVKDLHPVDHEIVLNWLKKGYNLLTEEELATAVYEVTGERMKPAAIKKRRERLGLTTERPTGPRPKSEQ